MRSLKKDAVSITVNGKIQDAISVEIIQNVDKENYQKQIDSYIGKEAYYISTMASLDLFTIIKKYCDIDESSIIINQIYLTLIREISKFIKQQLNFDNILNLLMQTYLLSNSRTGTLELVWQECYKYLGYLSQKLNELND